jgi:hypothetical protein
MKLPTLQKQFIPEYVSQTAGAEMKLAGQLMDTAGQIAKKIQDTRDTAEAQEEVSTMKLNALRKQNELAVQYGDNPDKFREEFDSYLENTKADYVANTKVSPFNKKGFSQIVSNNISNLKLEGFRTERNLDLSNTERNLKATLNNNAELSYEYGRNINYEDFVKNNEVETAKLEVSARDVLTPNQIRETIDGAKRNNYIKYIEGNAVSDLNGTLEQLKGGFYRDALPQETVDDLIGKLTDIQKKSEGSNPQLTKTLLDIETGFNVLNLKTVNGKKNTIPTNAKEYKNIAYLSELNNRIEEARTLGLKDAPYIKYKEDIYNTVYNNFIEQGDKKEFIKNNKGWLFSKKTAENSMVDYLNKYVVGFDKMEKSQLFLELGSALQENGVDLKSEDPRTLRQTEIITEAILRKMYNIPDNEKVNNFMMNRKINKQLEFNQTVIDTIENNDPFKLR